MSAAKTVALLILSIAVIAGMLLMRNPEEPPPMLTEQRAAAGLSPSAADTTEAVSANAQDAAESPASCLTTDEVNVQPVVQAIMKKSAAATTQGADIEIFRGLELDAARGFAEQGDSAAMAVTGAILVMRAFNLPDSLAIDWLNSGGHIEGKETGLSPSSEASLILNDAAYWFYEAALNGRVMALQHYGQVRGQVFGGPVGLGWIGRDEYDFMDDEEKNELSPEIMYARVAMDLAPAFEDDVIRGPSKTSSGSEIVDRIRTEIHQEFSATLLDSGLPPPITTEAEAAELERLRRRICDPE